MEKVATNVKWIRNYRGTWDAGGRPKVYPADSRVDREPVPNPSEAAVLTRALSTRLRSTEVTDHSRRRSGMRGWGEAHNMGVARLEDQ